MSMTWRAISARPCLKAKLVDNFLQQSAMKPKCVLFYAKGDAPAQYKAGGSFTSSTRPTLDQQTDPARLCEHSPLKVSHAPISFECSLSNPKP